MEPFEPDDDRQNRSSVSAFYSQSSPLRKVGARQMGMVFRMGVPFAQVSDSSTTCFPSLLCYRTMTERHAFKQCSQLSVHPGRRRRFGNEYPLSVNGAEEKATGFRRGDGRLHMC